MRRRWLYRLRNGPYVEYLYVKHAYENISRWLKNSHEHAKRWRIVSEQ